MPGLVSGGETLPLVKGQPIVARVEGETITRAELAEQMNTGQESGQAAASAHRGTAQAVLDRMINVILIAQEARRTGLDQLPEIKRAVDAQARLLLREELVERIIADVKADPKDIETLYRSMVRQWRVSAVLFASEQQANALAADVAAGKLFNEISAAFVADGRATRRDEDVVLKKDSTEPEVAKAVEALSVGATSPVIHTKAGHVVLRLNEVQYPDEPSSRERAERIVLTAKRQETLANYNEELKKKYIKIDEALLQRLDYESDTPGMEALLKDQRPLARVKGEKPVTVAELSEALKYQFFHGIAMAAERKRLNAKKEQVLGGLLHRKVFRKEALRLRLERTDSYRNKVKSFERSLLFDALVRKVVARDVKLTDDEVKAYYDGHRTDYTTPEMLRIRNLVFDDRANAEKTMASLKAGADLQWVAARADGRIEPTAAKALVFDGRPIMTTELPDAVHKAVDGVRAGDVRLYESPEGHFHVLSIEDVIRAQPRPYEDVRKEIGLKLLNAKIEAAIEAYARQLRSLSKVEVYLKASS